MEPPGIFLHDRTTALPLPLIWSPRPEEGTETWLFPGTLAVLRSLRSSKWFRVIPGEAASSLLSYISCPGWKRVTPKAKTTPLHPGLPIAGGLGQSLKGRVPLALLHLPGVGGNFDSSPWGTPNKPEPHLWLSGDEQPVPVNGLLSALPQLCPLATDTLIPHSGPVL